jgi:hypothetical protein
MRIGWEHDPQLRVIVLLVFDWGRNPRVRAMLVEMVCR